MNRGAPGVFRSGDRHRYDVGGGWAAVRVIALTFALALGVTAPAAGQGAGAGRDSTARSGSVAPEDTVRPPDLREQVLRKLRALEAASRPLSAKADSIKADSMRADSVRADSVRADSVRADSVRADSAAYKAVVGDSVGMGRSVPDTARAGALAADRGAGEPGQRTHPTTVSDSARAGVSTQVATGAAGDTARSDPRIRFGTGPSAGVIPASDSVAARLRALEGYVVTEYRAASARFAGESGQLDLVGAPKLVRGAESMTADSLLRFDQRTSIVCGYGKPVLTGTGSDPVSSDEVCYDVNRQVGVALGARTTFTQQGTWFVHGTELYTSGTDRLYGSATSFTSCDLDEPHYHFAASELKVVHNSVMVARNVTIKFGDVPVLWLPFMIQSLKPDRRSGLLTPTLGLQHVVRTSSGYRREIRNIGFYWALSENLGLTTAMDWQSGGYMALRGELQYSWLRQFLGGNVSFSRYWMAEGNTNFTLSGSSNWQPAERTSLRASVNYASSSDLVRRYSMDPEELNRMITSNVGLNHRFDWGTLSVNGSRQQHLSNDQVDLTLPSASISLNPVTLFAASSDPRWYNNATWQSNARFTARSREVNIDHPGETGRNETNLQGSVGSSLTMGKLSWNGNFTFDEKVQHARPTWYDPLAPDTVVPDSLVYNRSVGQVMKWSTGLNFTQRLIENTDFTPYVSLNGGIQMPTGLPDSLGVSGRVGEPTRIKMGASLRTNIFGFWPGVGPYSRIRHRLEPSLTYTYSPTPTVTDLQRRAFGTAYDALRETNNISLSLNQTFEAKPVSRDTLAEGVAEDSVAGAFGDAPPRRNKQVQPITLLSLTSSAVAYDFVKAREGDFGFTTERMTHEIRSDLVRGLSLTVGHDLFKKTAATEEAPESRRFSPRLRSVSARFSLSSDSWPFRLLRRDGGEVEESSAREAEMAADSLAADEQDHVARSIMPGSGSRSLRNSYASQAVGTWRGDFDYSLLRPPAGAVGMDDQMLGASLSFQPTENWNVSWQTRYSFTTHEFSNHTLALTRDLHRWRASFLFSRTQMGSFTFRFNVQLLDNPDIKVDYDQRSQAPPTQYR